MTEADHTAEGDRTHTAESRVARLRRRLRELDPAQFGLLGVLSIPGYLVDSLAFMQVFALFFLLFFWIWLEPIVDLALKRNSDADTEPTDWIHMGDWREWAMAYLMIPVTFLNLLVLVQDLLQMLGSGVAYVRHRGSVPAPGDNREVDYRLPLEGTWTVVNGSLEKEYSHSWLPLTQRYAYDFVITDDDDGRSRPEGTAPAVEAYYCYDEPVLAPADGVVVDVHDTDLEPSRGSGFAHPLKRDLRGNYVTIQHAAKEYSSLVHLVPGSVVVEPGDRVARGEEIGRCGHSGSSSEPHLHFQVQDHPVFEIAAGLPIEFEAVSVESPWLEDATESETAPEAVADGDETERDTEATAITAGQRVTADEVTGSDGWENKSNERDETDDRPPSVPDRERIATLERVALGTIVAGVLAFVSSIIAGPQDAAIAVATAALVGFGFWAIVGQSDRVRRPGGIGVPLGIGLVAVLWAGVPPLRSVTAVILLGVVGYVLLAEYDRHRLDQQEQTRPRSSPERDRQART